MKNIYSIRDIKTDSWHIPFFSPDDVSAIRSITMHLSEGNSQLSQFAADYELFQLGTFDESTGNIISLELKNHIISISTILSNMLRNIQLQNRLSESKTKDTAEKA